jgi:peptidoglycan hydrolase-like protein with peptidoglycan-binding domain
MSMKRLLLTTSVLALGLAGTAFAQSGAGSSAGAGAMGTNSGSPAYSSPSRASGSDLDDTSRPGTSGSSMNNENGTGANGGPMASGTGRSGMSGGRSRMSSSASGGASSDNVRQAQEALQDQGLYKGQVDGKMGPQTKHAIAQFQKQKGLKQTAQLDQPTMNDLQNGSMSGSDNSSSSPNGNPGDNSGSGAHPGMGGNGPATTQTHPGGQNRSSNPAP